MPSCTGVPTMNKTMSGGRRRRGKTAKKTRKGSKGSWTQKVTELYKKMKKADPSVQFRDALVKASKLKKAGQL